MLAPQTVSFAAKSVFQLYLTFHHKNLIADLISYEVLFEI